MGTVSWRQCCVESFSHGSASERQAVNADMHSNTNYGPNINICANRRSHHYSCANADPIACCVILRIATAN